MKRNVLGIFLFSGLFLLDRITKFWALHYLKEDVVVCPFINFSFVWNRGVTWGVFGGASSFGFYALTVVIAVIIAVFAAFTRVQYKRGEPIFFELCVLAGAVSNFFDRIYYGAVIDFIDCYIQTTCGWSNSTNGFSWHWPTFNVADACIVIGIGGIILRGLLWTHRKKF